jgi:hypothetical protein
MSAAAAFDPARCEQIALAQAVLCQDCETVSNTPHRYCPACGSQSLLQLARVLNRQQKDAPPKLAPWTAWRQRSREKEEKHG